MQQTGLSIDMENQKRFLKIVMMSAFMYSVILIIILALFI
jgi:hypothetical protein